MNRFHWGPVMIYQNVCLEAFAYTLPDEVVTSAEIEALLEPLYARLRLPEGRLELMTGITERRFWPRGTLAGQKAPTRRERGPPHREHRQTADRRSRARLRLSRFPRARHGLQRASSSGACPAGAWFTTSPTPVSGY